MKKYVTSPQAEGIGIALITYFNNLQSAQITPIITPVLQKYGYNGMEDLQPDRWYPVQISLDIFKALENQRNATVNLVSIGVKLVENMDLPSGIQTLAEAVELLNPIFESSVRNFPADEKYDVIHMDNNHVRLIDNSPYPHDLIYGFLYGIVQRYKPEGSYPALVRTYQNPDNPNADGAIYDITW